LTALVSISDNPRMKIPLCHCRISALMRIRLSLLKQD
jgi:hypothetical protein